MKLPILKIGELTPQYPIIQGGMAVNVSTAKLAAAVANEGGIGVIAGSAVSGEFLKNEILKAKKLTSGILGVNIMFAVKNFLEVVKASIEAKIDLIISGAGFSRDIFGICRRAGIPFVPIVSSLKLARISERLGAAAVIVEGGNAGGHIGTDKDSWDIVKVIKENLKIPVIGAGGIITREDMKKMFSLGVDGVQLGSRFLASVESDVSDKFKELVVRAKKSDMITIISAVGLPANAIRTKFSEMILNGNPPKPTYCDGCLKACTKKFCIFEALKAAKAGDLENGLFFAGKEAWKIKEILSVKEIFKYFFS